MEKLKERIKSYDDKQTEVLRICVLIVVLSIVRFSAGDYKNVKAEVIIWSVIVLCAVVLLVLYDVFDLEFYQFAFLCIIVMGILSLLIQPILNIPDEEAHFARAELVSRGQMIINRSWQEFQSIQATRDLRDYHEEAIIYTALKGMKIDRTPYFVNHVAAANATFLYIPQAIGMVIAKILNLNVIWLLWLGRFTNLLMYSLVIGLAVKITPCLKFPLFFVASLPMSIQQAASMSPDAMINSLSILLIAVFLNLYTREDRDISYKEILVFFVIGILLVTAKVTNICICGLFLLLPLQKTYGKNKAIMLKTGVVAGFVMIGAVYYYYTTTFASNLAFETYYTDNLSLIHI